MLQQIKECDVVVVVCGGGLVAIDDVDVVVVVVVVVDVVVDGCDWEVSVVQCIIAMVLHL